MLDGQQTKSQHQFYSVRKKTKKKNKENKTKKKKTKLAYLQFSPSITLMARSSVTNLILVISLVHVECYAPLYAGLHVLLYLDQYIIFPEC